MAGSDLIGPPTDTSSHITGKAFIPWYFGEDRAETEAYYKGSGGSSIRPRMAGGTLLDIHHTNGIKRFTSLQ